MGLKGVKMTAKDVLNLAVVYIGEPDLANTTTLGGSITPTDQQVEKLNLLLTCVNDTVQSLALMYFPLKYEQKITSETGVYSFSGLEKSIIDIVKITDEHNLNVDYASFPTYFEAKKGTLNIVYTYMPNFVEDCVTDLEIVENKVSVRLMALGVVSRYYMFLGMYSDANSWNSMFEQAALISARNKNNIVMKKRSWV